ncbi:MAG: divergent polysaccharide deacetylase family protein [Bacillota bacterium]
MVTKHTKPVKKQISKKKSPTTNWKKFGTILIVVVAFAVGIIYAGGCGNSNSGSNNESKQESVPTKDNGGTTKPGADTAKSAPPASDKKTQAANSKAATTNSTANSSPVKHTKATPGAPGRLAIIIDDCGYNSAALNTLAQIDAPLTFAVIPYLQSSNAAIAKGNASGKQLMVHLPMQSAGGSGAEKITILTTMSDSEIQKITRNAINAIPGAVGVNNHQGSKATADSRVMRVVMGVVAGDGLFFVDSMTNPASVACDVAREYGVATSENEIFLDNSDSVTYIKGRIAMAIDMARNKTIIAIGHARPNTAKALSEMAGEIQQSGIQMIFASEAVK